MRKIYSILVVLVCASLFSCGSKYNKLKINDQNSGSEYVYGEIGGPSRHSKNQSYPAARPETVEKANKFRKQVESNLVSAKK